MEFSQITELIDKISKSNINRFEMQNQGFKIKVCKDKDLKNVVQINDQHKDNQISNQSDNNKQDEHIVEIKSPIVGVFYAAPSPEEPPFVTVGSEVSKGDTLCIIEAMKTMNDITSDVSGQVTEILVENQEMVEYGQVLMKIKKDE